MNATRLLLIVVWLFLGISSANACYSLITKNAWVKLPSPHERQEFTVDGVRVNLRIKVAPAIFDAWASSCQFEFVQDGELEFFQWDSETFMGHMKYNRSIEELSIEAFRYD